MRRVPKPVLAVLALLLFFPPAGAWKPPTRVRMVDEAVRFMPRSLRLALETNREALLRGMLEPQTHEDEAPHLPSWSGGTLEQQIESEALGLLDLLATPAPFAEVARRFGGLAHYVLDAGFPPGVGGAGGARRYAHFAAFCEERRGKFPLVFYGHEDPDLQRGAWRAFAERVARRSLAEDEELARAYAAAGDPPSAEAFDDRSIPFAVGSLCYSRSINEVVRVWLAVWERAGGDMGRIPYRKPNRVKKD
jgi:hypothetical protein